MEAKLDSFEECVVTELDTPYPPGDRANPTADGKYVCSVVVEPDDTADKPAIGYHGFKGGDLEWHLFGFVGWEGKDSTEMNFPFRSMHFQSLDSGFDRGRRHPNCFQANARPYIQLFKWDGKQFVGPKILAYHRSTFNDQYAHCHPRFTPDGKYVLYSSDLTSYANMYLVEVGDFDDLPDLTDDYVAPHMRR